MHKVVTWTGLLLLGLSTVLAADGKTEKKIEKLEKEIAELKSAIEDEELPQRLDAVERRAAMDRINFTGDLRVAADSIDATQAAWFDGMALQKGVVDSMFYMQTNDGAFPMPTDPLDPASIYGVLEQNVAAHYSDYLYFTSNLTFADLAQAMAGFPPEQQAALMQMLLPALARGEQDYSNDVLYTTRMRLKMKAEIAPNVTFEGGLAMYKAWGDSTGVQVFNGQANSMNVDGTTVSVPNSDQLRVYRAYFNWNHIADSNFYLSIGRRPSTSGPPLEIREKRLRGGTPLGHVVDYQFDGLTLGYVFENLPGTIFRFCYGVGYESGFGSADQLRSPADRLDDAQFGGFNIDVINTDRMLIQATIMRAFDVTDGFNSLVVMPVDPVTGNPAPGPAVMRMTPSANLGDIDLQAVMMERNDGPLHWFVSLARSETDPKLVTTPFGGLLSDPFETPTGRSGSSVYAGVRWDSPSDRTSLGVEFNHGSQYWFNFTHAADDIVLSKLATRGDVWEAYWIQSLPGRMSLRLSAIDYKYDYSGSGWHLGAPKDLGAQPVLGFPTYKDVFNIRLALNVKF